MSPETAEILTTIFSRWVQHSAGLRGLAVIGSWARGDPRPESDLDLLIVAADPEHYRLGLSWTGTIGLAAAGFTIVAQETAQYGAVFSYHFKLSPKADVELSFAARSWAATNPIDTGTLRVARAGLAVIVDKDELFRRLLSEIARSG